MVRKISSYDKHQLREAYRAAKPFPHVVIDDFLAPDFARRVAQCFFSSDDARKYGEGFRNLHERGKVHITDPALFPAPVTELANELSSTAFIEDLSVITGIDDLVWDPTFSGGGMHQTSRAGWLDVHVDFNYNEALKLYRRLNILIYFNETWDKSWGGELELWDREVRRCLQRVQPTFNRCVIFTTSETSFHGVTAVECPEGQQRLSLAAYYYTRSKPPDYPGHNHSTIFRARPTERFKRHVRMPLTALWSSVLHHARLAKTAVKRIVRLR